MQREILFKAKRKDNNEWVYGYYWTNELGNHFIKQAKDEEGKYTTEDIEIIPSTICQYTGLNDKNGNMIFENNIVKYPNETEYQVMFDPTGYWCLDGNGVRNSEMLIQCDINKEIEVVGNKFDEVDNNE